MGCTLFDRRAWTRVRRPGNKPSAPAGQRPDGSEIAIKGARTSRATICMLALWRRLRCSRARHRRCRSSCAGRRCCLLSHFRHFGERVWTNYHLHGVAHFAFGANHERRRHNLDVGVAVLRKLALDLITNTRCRSNMICCLHSLAILLDWSSQICSFSSGNTSSNKNCCASHQQNSIHDILSCSTSHPFNRRSRHQVLVRHINYRICL